MTQNQYYYSQLAESRRHSMQEEAETQRHNREMEQINLSQLQESRRHSEVLEAIQQEQNRIAEMTIGVNSRRNELTEQANRISQLVANETQRTHLANEAISSAAQRAEQRYKGAQSATNWFDVVSKGRERKANIVLGNINAETNRINARAAETKANTDASRLENEKKQLEGQLERWGYQNLSESVNQATGIINSAVGTAVKLLGIVKK